MRGKTRCWLSLSIGLLLTGLPGLAAQSMVTCMERGKKFFSEHQYDQAKTIFSQCVKEEPDNMEALLSLAGVELTQDNLDEAEKIFKSALQKAKRTSPYISYTYSILGDISLKKQKNAEALDYYSKSLESNAANVNSLVGKGVILEFQGDKETASEFYRTALAVEPLNLIARQRLVNLEPQYFTDAEILAALKQRYAIAPETKELTDKQRQLFADIHSAEQRKGIDYLKNKYHRVPSDYMVTLNKGTEFERDILTLAGYEALTKHVGQDAISVFQQIGVPIQSVFLLRDFKGEKIFKEDSTLTQSGFFVYTEALQNRKRFLLPEEPVPPTPAKLAKINKRVESLKNQGFVQISLAEKKRIEKETFCSEETLRSELGLVIVPVTSKKRYYFVAPNNPADAKESVSYYFVMKNRAKKNPSIQVPANNLVESLQYYNYTVCLESDGKML